MAIMVRNSGFGIWDLIVRRRRIWQPAIVEARIPGPESRRLLCAGAAILSLLAPRAAAAAPVPLDLSGVRPGPISVTRTDDTVAVAWPDETGRTWTAIFSLDPAQPLITAIGSGGDP